MKRTKRSWHPAARLLLPLLLCLALLAGCAGNQGGGSKGGRKDSSSVSTASGSLTDTPSGGAVRGTPTPAPLEKIAAKAAPDQNRNAPFQMTALNVGQGLSVLIKADGKYMLYDGGGRSRSSYVFSYLQKHGAVNLAYVTASHYDEDHIAGLIGVLLKDKVSAVLCPDYQTDTNIYRSFTDALRKSGADAVHPKSGSRYTLGKASFQVVSAENAAETDNDRSIALRIRYGKMSVLLTGDCAEEAEDGMLRSGYDLNSDVYVAGHHGSRYSSSSRFLNAVKPSDTIISCGAGNFYGHPSAEALDRIKAAGSSLYRTDRQGEISVYSDGTRYWFSEQPCNDWTPGQQPQQDKQTAAAQAQNRNGARNGQSASSEYVLNVRSKRFHRPGCSAADRTKPENRKTVRESRETLIAQGYQPCGICHP